jgi:hypothetical protein
MAVAMVDGVLFLCVCCAATIPRRLAVKLGPNAQVPKLQKPLALPKTVPASGPSLLLELLKAIPEACVGTCSRQVTSLTSAT